MKIETYLKRHPEVKEFYLQAKDEVAICNRDNFDDMNHYGWWKIKRVEEPPCEGELVTLIVQ